jgi:hypothetical protein
MSTVNSISKSIGKSTVIVKPKRHPMQTLINYGTLLVFIIVVVGIYKYFIINDYQRLRTEGFQNFDENSDTNSNNEINTTIYEKSITNIYGKNIRLICGMLPKLSKSSSICNINNEMFVPYNFPIHIIKLLDGTILSVFNDGRLYKKDSMLSTLWAGPITNSMPENSIPMRMITLSTDLVTLLGVGFDNILYIKKPDAKGNTNLTIQWTQVPNNSSIIYVLFDNITGYLLSIDIEGKILTKNNSDITSDNQELVTKLDRPILRLYYDLNGYMLAIDNNFDLYQFSDINWKDSALNTSRGANNSKLQDLLYDNDGKMYGLVFNDDAFMVKIMKQNSVFYLSDFFNLEEQITSDNNSEFVMSDQDILLCKIGNITDYLNIANDNDEHDDDPNFAYQKQTLENQKKLREFCSKRSVLSSSINYDNYDLLSSVDKNNDKIKKLKNIVNNLLSYDPNSNNIKQKFPIISQQ